MTTAKRKPPTAQVSADELAIIRRQIAVSRDVLERYAHEAENSQALYERFLVFDRRIKKVLDELSERIERIERLLLLDKTGHEAPAGEIRSEIRQELTSLQWQLNRRIKNLNYLKEQAAGYGAGRVDLDLINQIADETEEIQRLQSELERARNEAKK